MRRYASHLVLALLVTWLSVVGLGCPCTDSVINSSPWLRWQIFANFGANRVCDEMTSRGTLLQVPVPVPGFPPAIGRFYPQTCQSNLNNEQRTLQVWMTGDGYAWTPATQKMSFECSVAIEYKPDFNKDGDTVYAWFDTANSSPPQFRITYVEQAATNAALRLYPVEWFARSLAQQFVASQLERGFTVIQESDRQDFSLGHLAVGQRPAHPWGLEDGERYTYANETTKIRGLQQDFCGPFRVDDDDQALFVKAQVTGSPIDIFVVPKDEGHAWRKNYQGQSPPPPPPPGARIIQQVATPPTGTFDGWVKVTKGSYYVVLDNSASAGLVSPPAKLPTPFDPSPAREVDVSYLIQLGEAPN